MDQWKLVAGVSAAVGIVGGGAALAFRRMCGSVERAESAAHEALRASVDFRPDEGENERGAFNFVMKSMASYGEDTVLTPALQRAFLGDSLVFTKVRSKATGVITDTVDHRHAARQAVINAHGLWHSVDPERSDKEWLRKFKRFLSSQIEMLDRAPNRFAETGLSDVGKHDRGEVDERKLWRDSGGGVQFHFTTTYWAAAAWPKECEAIDSGLRRSIQENAYRLGMEAAVQFMLAFESELSWIFRVPVFGRWLFERNSARCKDAQKLASRISRPVPLKAGDKVNQLRPMFVNSLYSELQVGGKTSLGNRLMFMFFSPLCCFLRTTPEWRSSEPAVCEFLERFGCKLWGPEDAALCLKSWEEQGLCVSDDHVDIFSEVKFRKEVVLLTERGSAEWVKGTLF